MKLTNIKEFVSPSSIDGVIETLGRYGNRAIILAGGTSILAFEGDKGRDIILSLKRVGLNYLRLEAEEWVIGAMTPVSSLPIEDPNRVEVSLFKKATGSLASPSLRNMITLGGNVVQTYYWSDLPPLLLSLGARFVIRGERERVVEADEFFSKHPKRILGDKEFLKEIRVPSYRNDGWKGGFKKFSRTSFDFSLVTCSILLKIQGRNVEEAIVAFGALSPLPFRFRRAEDYLVDKGLTRESIESLCKITEEEIEPAPDFRTERWYKKRVAGVLLMDILNEILDKDQG